MKKNIFNIVICVLLVISLGANAYLFYRFNLIENSSSNGKVEGQTVVGTVHDVTSDTTEVVKKVQDSIVTVEVYTNQQLSSSGSGVVYQKEDGKIYIITNHHVIDGGQTINLLFSDGQSVEAKTLGSDEYTDLAILEAKPDFDVTPIDVGDSNLLDVGEPVLAIGSPLGSLYSGTTTQGIVSAVNRVVSVDLNGDNQDDWDMNVIQTDAAINPGNSGGALINLEGELVGITSMKISNGAEGIGFAIPISDAIQNIQQLKEKGEIVRPVLGIQALAMNSISSYNRYYNDIQSNSENGIYVYSVQKGSAADVGGMKKGDIITTFAGEEVKDYKSFLNLLYAKQPRDTVEIIVDRSGTNFRLNITLK